MMNRYAIYVLLVAVLAFGAGFQFSEVRSDSKISGVENMDVGQPDNVDFSLFWDAWRLIQDRHVDSDSLDYSAMVQGAIRGMVDSIDDPHTVFMDPEETGIFFEDITGTFEGVGMEIGIREDELRVIAPLEGTPASRAGLRAGDTIISIDDTFARDLSIDQAVSLIRGPQGTEVVLGVLRDGWNEPRDISVERDVIEVPAVTWELIDGNVAHIKMTHFSQNMEPDFKAAASEILASNADRIVIDLRNNPGGYLGVAQNMAGWFMEPDSVVTIEQFGDGRDNKEHRTSGNARFVGFPMVVLLNEGSASASEILAGALRDNMGVQIIGKTSFGKGSVQQVEKLRDDSTIKITVAHWLTPSGELIEGQGIEPDIEVDMTEEDFDADEDPQLDRALEVLQEM